MPSRRLLIPLALLLALLAAAPARATLLVRSDGAGLLIEDKNGLGDHVTIRPDSLGYQIVNGNSFDVFAFDTQAGCSSSGHEATCDRNGPVMNIQLAGGDDHLSMFQAPVGQASVAGSA